MMKPINCIICRPESFQVFSNDWPATYAICIHIFLFLYLFLKNLFNCNFGDWVLKASIYVVFTFKMIILSVCYCRIVTNFLSRTLAKTGLFYGRKHDYVLILYNLLLKFQKINLHLWRKDYNVSIFKKVHKLGNINCIWNIHSYIFTYKK